jgi:hypothetical protein
MNLRYRVELSQAERDELKSLLAGGKHASRKLKRAQILLAADGGARDEEIATSIGRAARPSTGPSGQNGPRLSRCSGHARLNSKSHNHCAEVLARIEQSVPLRLSRASVRDG